MKQTLQVKMKRIQAGPKQDSSRTQARPKRDSSRTQARPKQEISRTQAGPKQGPSRNQDELIPKQTDQATDQATNQAKGVKQKESSKRSQAKGAKQRQILNYCSTPHDMNDIMSFLGYKNRQKFRLNHIKPLLEEGLLSMTIPEKPNHNEQKYITTEKGKVYQSKIII